MTNPKPQRYLCISGSLRTASLNTLALRALQQLAPAHIDVQLFDRVGEIPLFNPDDDERPHAAVVALKEAVAAADVLVLASPEYAHGISGVMKNLLDHLVSGEEFVGLRVVLVNTSPRAHIAQDSLAEVVRTMGGDLLEGVEVELLGGGLVGVEDVLGDVGCRGGLLEVFEIKTF